MNEYICIRQTFFKMRLFEKGDIGYGKDFAKNPNFEPKNKNPKEAESGKGEAA